MADVKHQLLDYNTLRQYGDYPALIQVVGPGNQKIYEHKTTITIKGAQNGVEPPLAQPVFSVELPIKGAIKSSLDYESGLMVSVNEFGSGNRQTSC